MPPLPPVNKVLKVELMGTDSGGFPWANVIHYQYTGTGESDSDLNNLAAALSEAWNAQMAPVCHTDVTLTDVAVTDLTSPTSAAGGATVAIAGTRTGSIIPGSAAFLISYPGAGPRYRGGHPRQYLLCGVQADLLNESHWTDAFVAEAQSAWQDFCAAEEGSSFGPITISSQCAVSYYYTDYGPPKVRARKVTPDQYVISAIVGNAQLASQRRRIGRRRR